VRAVVRAPSPQRLDRGTRFVKRPFIVWLVLTLAVAIAAGCGGSASSGLARGNALYDTCAPCHGENGAGDQNLRAPSIAGLPQWYVEAQLNKFSKAHRGQHPDDLEGARMRPTASA
jgi:cytochrome c553